MRCRSETTQNVMSTTVKINLILASITFLSKFINLFLTIKNSFINVIRCDIQMYLEFYYFQEIDIGLVTPTLAIVKSKTTSNSIDITNAKEKQTISNKKLKNKKNI